MCGGFRMVEVYCEGLVWVGVIDLRKDGRI